MRMVYESKTIRVRQTLPTVCNKTVGGFFIFSEVTTAMGHPTIFFIARRISTPIAPLENKM